MRNTSPFEIVEALQCALERLARQVLRLLAPAGVVIAVRVDLIEVAVVKRAKCLAVPLGGFDQARLVLQLRCRTLGHAVDLSIYVPCVVKVTRSPQVPCRRWQRLPAPGPAGRRCGRWRRWCEFAP